MEQTKVEYDVAGREAVLSISGEFDVATAAVVAAVANRLSVESGGTIRVDLQEVTFIDSTGLRALLRLDGLAATVELLQPSPAVIRVLTLTGLLDHFPLANTHAGKDRLGRWPPDILDQDRYQDQDQRSEAVG